MASGPSKGGNAAEIDRLALILAKEPGSKAFIPLAEEYGKAGMWQEAAGVLEDGLKTYPNFITAMVALGRTYEQLNEPVKAKAILEEAVRLSPENLRAHRTLAKIYITQGFKEAALRSCGVILSVNPQDEEALSFRATLTAPSMAGVSGSDPVNPSIVPASTPAVAIEEASTGSTSMIPPVVPLEESEPVLETLGQKNADLIMSACLDRAKDNAASVARLEQWLGLIQTRRRDRDQPHNLLPPQA